MGSLWKRGRPGTGGGVSDDPATALVVRPSLLDDVLLHIVGAYSTSLTASLNSI